MCTPSLCLCSTPTPLRTCSLGMARSHVTPMSAPPLLYEAIRGHATCSETPLVWSACYMGIEREGSKDVPHGSKPAPNQHPTFNSLSVDSGLGIFYSKR